VRAKYIIQSVRELPFHRPDILNSLAYSPALARSPASFAVGPLLVRLPLQPIGRMGKNMNMARARDSTVQGANHMDFYFRVRIV
jgi:hypothetical protein